MFKFNKSLILFSFLLIGILLISSCDGRKGKLNANTPPVITITDYFGSDSLAGVEEPNLFQQTIRWSAYDTDGVIYGYAFRVIDENGNPFHDIQGNVVGTPGYSCVNDSGWVYHYQPGADESIPLEDPDAMKTIWTSQVYAVINFPANVNGDSANVVSTFEVKCIDNIGDESIPAKKYFNAESTIPIARVQSTKGEIDGETIGLGIVFEFQILGDEPFIGEIADYYEFILEKKDLNGNLIPFNGTPQGGYDLDINDPEDWISTRGQADVAHYTMTRFTTPALIPNTIDNDVPADSTFLTVKAIDIAGIISEPVEITFVIKEGFYPGTLIYVAEEKKKKKNDTWVLGQNHFVTYMDQSIPKVIPSIMTADGAHFATPFWIDTEGKLTAIGSQDFRVYLHWGWHGEFETDQPDKRRVGQVYDELTNTPYFAEIISFDIRIDDEAYVYGPLPASDYNVIDDDGTEWLRVPIYHDISQHTNIYGDYTSTGSHKVEIRAVDLQDVADETPAEFTFFVEDFIPKEEKAGILIIDDEENHPSQSPEAIVDTLYNYFFDSQNDVVEVNRVDVADIIGDMGLSALHFYRAVFSPTDIQQYKLIVYHSDKPLINTTSNFDKEYDSLNLYLSGGGNLLFSGGANIVAIQQKCQKDGLPLLEYFGIPRELDDEELQAVHVVTHVNPESGAVTQANFFKLQFMVKATATNGFTDDILLQLPGFNNLVNMKYGLGPVAYFDNLLNGTETIFEFGCKFKDPDGNGLDPTFLDWDADYDTDQYPNEDQYNEFTGKAVAIKRITENNNCYFFGFPLSYMNKDDVKAAMQVILDEIQ